jgi:hypothetical protein
MSDIVFESPADQEGFTQIPNVVLKDGAISPQAKTLYACLRMHAWSGDSSFPGQKTLAGYIGCTDRSIRDYLRELEAQFLVATERRGSTSNRYVLLALGLRFKRLADRKPASDRDDRSSASGQTGSLLPTKKTQGKKTQKGSVGAREKLRVSGKPVKADRWALTERVLAEFNRQAERKLRLLTSAGQPSEAAKRIYGRLLLYPDLSFDEHSDIIRRTLASRWWGADPPSIGVVFGPNVFEENITRPEVPSERAAKLQRQKEKEQRLERGHETLMRIMGGA